MNTHDITKSENEQPLTLKRLCERERWHFASCIRIYAALTGRTYRAAEQIVSAVFRASVESLDYIDIDDTPVDDSVPPIINLHADIPVVCDYATAIARAFTSPKPEED